MRQSVADYQVIEALAPGPPGSARYLCRAPKRLGCSEPVLVAELAVDASRWRRLVERLSRLSAIEGEHLMELLEAGPDLGTAAAGVYLATEGVTGGTLAKPSEPLDDAAKIRAVARAALGAHELHEAGIAHGGIGLDSVMLAERGALLTPPRLDAADGAVCRIRSWRDVVAMDPDLLCGEPPSRSSDVWSLGATLHLVLSGQPLYPGIDRDAPVTAVQRVLFTRPEVDPALPGSIASAISACLDPDPGMRPPTAAEVASLLDSPGARA